MRRMNRNLPFRHMDARPLLRSAEYQITAGNWGGGRERVLRNYENDRLKDLWFHLLSLRTNGRGYLGRELFSAFFFFFLAYWVWDFYIIKEDCAAGGQSMNLNFAWETASGWYNTLHPDFDFPPTCKSLERFFLFSPAISLIFIPSFSVFVAGRFSDSQLVIYLEAALAC